MMHSVTLYHLALLATAVHMAISIGRGLEAH